MGRRAAYAAVVTAVGASAGMPARAPAEMATTSPMVREFARMGVDFWRARGVRPCEHPIVLRADMGPQFHGAAYPGTCRIWISSGLIDAARRERWRRLAGGDSAREELCTTIFHELGHTAGLEHTESGLMSIQGIAVPWACHAWRLRADREQRRRFGRSSTVCNVASRKGERCGDGVAYGS